MDDRYFPPFNDARWAITRSIGGRTVSIVEGSYLDGPQDAKNILLALGIPPTKAALSEHFPGKNGGPTLELIEQCAKLDPTNPKHDKVRVAISSV